MSIVSAVSRPGNLEFVHDGQLRRAEMYAPDQWVERRLRESTALPLLVLFHDGGNAYAGRGKGNAGHARFFAEVISQLYADAPERLDSQNAEIQYDQLFITLSCEAPTYALVPAWRVPASWDGSSPLVPDDFERDVFELVVDGTWQQHGSMVGLTWRSDDVGYADKAIEICIEQCQERYDDAAQGSGGDAIDMDRIYFVGSGCGGTFVYRMHRKSKWTARGLAVVNGTLGGASALTTFPPSGELPPTVWIPRPGPGELPPDLLQIVTSTYPVIPYEDSLSYMRPGQVTPWIWAGPNNALVNYRQSALEVYSLKERGAFLAGLSPLEAAARVAPFHVDPQSTSQVWRGVYSDLTAVGGNYFSTGPTNDRWRYSGYAGFSQGPRYHTVILDKRAILDCDGHYRLDYSDLIMTWFLTDPSAV